MEPSVQLDTKKALVVALQTYHGIISDACRKVGISRQTYYDWLKNDPEFKAAAEETQEEAIDFVESKLFEKVSGVKVGKHDSEGELVVYEQPPSDTAIIFYLKTKAKKRGYIERQEITGADGAPFPVISVQVVNPEK